LISTFFCSTEQPRLFEKVVFDVQLPDCLQKFFPIQFFAQRLLAPLSINDVVCAFDQFRFPSGYLIRMDLVLLGDVVDGLVVSDRLHGNLGLEFGGIDLSVLSHGYLAYYCHLHVGRNPPYSTVQFSRVTIPSHFRYAISTLSHHSVVLVS